MDCAWPILMRMEAVVNMVMQPPIRIVGRNIATCVKTVGKNGIKMF